MGQTHIFEEICSEKRRVNAGVLKQTVSLAVEIAREGREGRKIGTLFVLCSAAVGLVGLWFVQSDEYRGAFLLAPSVFPQAFGWVMRLQPPERAIGVPRVAER